MWNVAINQRKSSPPTLGLFYYMLSFLNLENNDTTMSEQARDNNDSYHSLMLIHAINCSFIAIIWIACFITGTIVGTSVTILGLLACHKHLKKRTASNHRDGEVKQHSPSCNSKTDCEDINHSTKELTAIYLYPNSAYRVLPAK